MHKRMLALLFIFAMGGSAYAQTVNKPNPYDVPMPPVVDMPSTELAAVSRGRVTPELLTSIIDWLGRDFSIPPNYRHPRIEFVSPVRLAAVRYRALAAGAAASARGHFADEQFMEQMRDTVALYEDATQTIFLSEAWNATKPADFSVLVHEFVHHLQQLAGLKYPCAEAREKQAYAAQEKWLRMAGRDFFAEFETDPISLTLRTTCSY